MRKLLLALCLFVCLTVAALADPITINVSQTPRGFAGPSDFNGPCARNLFCRPLTSSTLEIYNDSNQLIGTVQSNSGSAANGTLLTLDIGQTGVVNLGGFTFTGAGLTALPLEYSFFVGFAVAGSVNGWNMDSLLTLSNGSLSVRSFNGVMGVPAIATFLNGERFQFGGVTTTNGSLSVSITRLGPASEVPEPMTLVLLGSGLAGLVAVRRRRCA